jgi:antitoxin HicB
MSDEKKFDHTGSSFDSFLEEEGILDETEAVEVKRVLAWQLKQAMEKRRVTKKALAEELKTSRSQVDRFLDPRRVGVTLDSITKAAKVLGKRVRVEIVDGPKKKQRAG